MKNQQLVSDRVKPHVPPDLIELLVDTQEYRALSQVGRELALLLIVENGDRKAVYQKLNFKQHQKTYGNEVVKSPAVQAFLEKARLLIAQRQAETGQWTFQQSLEYSKGMLKTLQDTLKECRDIENTSQRIQRIVDVVKAIQFWKENLDRIHGFMSETVKSLNVSANLKELVDIKNERDLIDLARNLELLAEEAEAELHRTAPQRSATPSPNTQP